MTLDISIDYEEQMITMVVDNSLTVYAYKESDNAIKYSKLQKIGDEDTQEKLKVVCETLLSIEEF